MQRGPAGYSLVELLIACALGLVIVSASLQFFARQVQAQREQLVEARLHQDLRAASDLIVRGLRRAGHHGLAGAERASPYRDIGVAPQSLAFSHTREAVDNGLLDAHERAGFRLLTDGSLQAMVGGRWQALNDPAVVTIVRFDVALAHHRVVPPDDCAALLTRALTVTLEGRPVADPQRLRRVSTNVAVRNDDVDPAACAATAPEPRETGHS